MPLPNEIWKRVGDTSPWTVPAGVSRIWVSCYGGGGGGGASSGTNNLTDMRTGGGGGGGAYASREFDVVPGQVFNFYVGRGGAGEVAGGAAAQDGEPTWFSSVLTLKAAGGFAGIGILPGNGGPVNNCAGDVKHRGGNGGGGIQSPAVSKVGGGGGAGSSGSYVNGVETSLDGQPGTTDGFNTPAAGGRGLAGQQSNYASAERGGDGGTSFQNVDGSPGFYLGGGGAGAGTFVSEFVVTPKNGGAGRHGAINITTDVPVVDPIDPNGL